MNRIELLTTPTQSLLDSLKETTGDYLVLGAGGKMGLTLCVLLKRSLDRLGKTNKVFAVSRFNDPEVKTQFEDHEINAISGDLLNEKFLNSLDVVENVIYMAGTKFGTSGHESLTWAMNSYLPGRVAEKFRDSKIVVFSTGNVYPFTKVNSGGPDEICTPEPIGEYAQSCLGRERIFEYFSVKNHTPMAILRINYAIDLTYGVLVDIAQSVLNKKAIDLTMGHVNIIWQRDANAIALRALHHCKTPPEIFNVTGNETFSVQWLAEEFGKFFNITPIFKNTPADTALLSNSQKAIKNFGPPEINVQQMLAWVSEWLLSGGETLAKPTHFQERKGNF